MKTGLRQQNNAVWQRLREPVWQLSTLRVRTSHTPEKHACSNRDLTIMMDNAAALGVIWQEEFHFHYAPICAFKWSLKGIRFI